MSSTWTIEIETAVPAPHLFKAAVVDWHNLAPKIASDKIVSAVPVEGTGGVGSIRQFNFTPGTVLHIYIYLCVCVCVWVIASMSDYSNSFHMLKYLKYNVFKILSQTYEATII
jgi:hypothetical protein